MSLERKDSFVTKSDTHIVLVSIFSFVIINITLLLLASLIKPQSEGNIWVLPLILINSFITQYSTYTIFTLLLSFAVSTIWLVYKKPSSKMSIFWRIMIPFTLLYVISLILYFPQHIILNIIYGLIFGLPSAIILSAFFSFIYGILYFKIPDTSTLHLSPKILIISLMILLILFPVWNYILGKIIVTKANKYIERYIETEASKTFTNITAIDKKIGFTGYSSGRYEQYRMEIMDIGLLGDIYGCKEKQCWHIECKVQIGELRITPLNELFFVLNDRTIDLQESKYLSSYYFIYPHPYLTTECTPKW